MSNQPRSSRASQGQTFVADQKFHQTLFDSLPIGICQVSSTGRILRLNIQGERILGRTESTCLGKFLHELIHCFFPPSSQSQSLCPITHVIKTGNPVNRYQSSFCNHNGETRHIEYQCHAMPDPAGPGAILLFQDITSFRQFENEQQRIKKLDALEALAKGIANKFDNLLTTILGNLFVAKLRAQTHGALANGLQEAEQACLQAKDMTKQLLTFANNDPPNTGPLPLGDIVRRSVIQALSGSSTGCQFFIPEDLWDVEGDEVQLKQVIHNLVNNAKQAMPDGGLLTLRGENVENEDIPSYTGENVNVRSYVKLTFEDQGEGITAEHLSQIFDPYFTTHSHANGLGLTIAHSIVRHHRGYIGVDSKPGTGTTIAVFLPKFEVVSIKTNVTTPTISQGKGRVLVMDDNLNVLTMVQDALTQFGYEATSVQDGKEAISIFTKAKQTGSPFSAVLLDLMVQSGMGGKETLEHLIKEDPQVKAIVTSGYSDNPIMENFRKHGFSACLVKPYTISKLHDVLRTTLESNTASFS